VHLFLVEFENLGLAPAIQLSFDNPALGKARTALAEVVKFVGERL